MSHHSDVPHLNLGHILEHGLWSYSLTWNRSQDKIIILVATKELVLEISHDLILNLILGFAPWDWSRLRNMLRNISFVTLILSLIISKQRVPSSLRLLLTEEAPLLVFSPCYALCLGLSCPIDTGVMFKPCDCICIGLMYMSLIQAILGQIFFKL